MSAKQVKSETKAPRTASKRNAKSEVASPVVSTEPVQPVSPAPVSASPSVASPVVPATVVVSETVAPVASSTEPVPEGGSSVAPVPEQRFRKVINDLREEMDAQMKVLKDIRSNLKKLESSYQYDLNHATRHSKKKKLSVTKPSGFVKELELSSELAGLIGVEAGTRLSMPTYTKKFYEMLKANNLFYEKDGRVLRANAEIMRVFKLPASVNESTNYKDKEGFNFYTLQKHIASVNRNRPVVAQV